MYFKRLELYDDREWNDLLSEYQIEDRDKIKYILSFENKEQIEKHFGYLESLGIINGIGPSWFHSSFRYILTALFPGIDFRFHDIEYFIGGDELNRNNADFGLFKYGMLSIVNDFNKIHSLEILFIFKEMFLILLIPLSILKFLILIIFWRLLVYGGGKAFNYIF